MTSNIDQVLPYFRELRASGSVTVGEYTLALKRYVKYGRAWVIRKGVKFTWSHEAFSCDCGKGIYCPLIKQEGKSIQTIPASR